MMSREMAVAIEPLADEALYAVREVALISRDNYEVFREIDSEITAAGISLMAILFEIYEQHPDLEPPPFPHEQDPEFLKAWQLDEEEALRIGRGEYDVVWQPCDVNERSVAIAVGNLRNELRPPFSEAEAQLTRAQTVVDQASPAGSGDHDGRVAAYVAHALETLRSGIARLNALPLGHPGP